jgi:hypothetical protein
MAAHRRQIPLRPAHIDEAAGSYLVGRMSSNLPGPLRWSWPDQQVIVTLKSAELWQEKSPSNLAAFGASGGG